MSGQTMKIHIINNKALDSAGRRQTNGFVSISNLLPYNVYKLYIMYETFIIFYKLKKCLSFDFFFRLKWCVCFFTSFFFNTINRNGMALDNRSLWLIFICFHSHVTIFCCYFYYLQLKIFLRISLLDLKNLLYNRTTIFLFFFTTTKKENKIKMDWTI